MIVTRAAAPHPGLPAVTEDHSFARYSSSPYAGLFSRSPRCQGRVSPSSDAGVIARLALPIVLGVALVFRLVILWRAMDGPLWPDTEMVLRAIGLHLRRFTEIAGKQLEPLAEIVPGLRRVRALEDNPDPAAMRPIRQALAEAARGFGRPDVATAG